ncbi:MAG: hypothetical protein LBJ81_00665 [Puniceicoccales bacterium]|jgi:hypothetical protein|nr:hypothetical protein [Puniceicoccales bacterium]
MSFGKIDLGRGNYATFSGNANAQAQNATQANLHLSNGREFTISVDVATTANTGRGIIGTIKAKVRAMFTTKVSILRKLAQRQTLSGPELKKAMQCLTKFYRQGDQSAKVKSMIENLTRPTGNQTSATVQETAASQCIEALCGPEQLREVFRIRDQNIFSKANAAHYGAIMQAAFDQARIQNGFAFHSASNDLQQAIARCLENLPDPPAKKDFLTCISKMKKATIAALDQLSPGQGKKLFAKYYPEALNNNSAAWVPFRREVALVTKRGTTEQFASALTPAHKMGCFSYLGGDGQPAGISSMDRNTPHAMNLWETRVTSSDGQPLFQAIRHGCTRGQKSASEEILTACLAQKFGMKQLTNGTKNEGTADNPYSLQLANMQLMTPGGSITGVSTDKSLPLKQIKGFRELANRPQPIALTIPTPNGRQIFVKLEPPLLFNFPTNLQHFTHGIRMVEKDEGGEIKKQNTASMEALLGKRAIESASIHPNDFNPQNIDLDREKNLFPEDSLVGKFLRSDAPDDKKKIVVQLAHQIADIWRSDQHKTNATEPYAIQSRIALLTYQLGLSTTFNCKSGKDRTGILDTETKNLAMEIEMNGGIVPESYHTLDDREKYNLSSMVDASGANHVTRACTGVAGLKIQRTFGPFRFSGVENRAGDVLGAAKLAKG